MIIGGKSNAFIFEARLWIVGDSSLRTSEVFVVHFSWKGSLSESLQCGCLSHTTTGEFLKPTVWVVLTYASREKREEVVE